MSNFQKTFKALTGFAPLHWQERLFSDFFLAGALPDVCDLPTGLGKTSVIPIWLIALASQFSMGQKLCLPRRLIYVVNRRTVVDQATEICENLRTKFGTSTPENWSELEWMHSALSKMRATHIGPILAISTLRGELADNEEWKADPARPAIIVGTVDMIGSKLLFKGYGDSYKTRPHHTGFIGQDALFVHDEAHLTPAFGELLRAVAHEQRHCNEPRPIRILDLSATTQAKSHAEVFELTAQDKQDAIVQRRINSQKQLRLYPIEDKGQIQKQIVDLALAYQDSACKVLIYVQAPKHARQIVNSLKQKLGDATSSRVALLTGTLRGFERDQLVQTNPVYRALLNAESTVPHTVFLVSTSAGEVGIDLDADHLVCDLTTLDSMIQRLGRVNRRGGEGRVAQIDVVFTSITEEELQSAKAPDMAMHRTLEALQTLPMCLVPAQSSYDARPLHLRELLKQWPDAVSLSPRRLPLTDILFDAWALTSGTKGLVNAPEVEPYLHGLEKEQPETYVAWRKEVSLLANTHVDLDSLQDWFKNCRIESQERLREPTYQLIDELKKLAQRCGNRLAIKLAPNGEAELLTVQKMANASFGELMYATIVLPVEIGGLSPEGLFDAKCDVAAVDVAEAKHQRERRILHRHGETYSDEPLMQTGDIRSNSPETVFANAAQAASAIARRKRWSLASKFLVTGNKSGDEDNDGEQEFLLLLVEPKRAALENPDSVGYSKQPTVDEHCDLAEQWARRFASALDLNPLQQEAVVIAARWHDRGKDRPLWQHSIYNYGSIPFAKSGLKGMDGRSLGGYRHELGSLLEAMRDEKIAQHPEHDLILHLIAVHHGWARPHFSTNAHDERFTTVDNQQAVLETMRRFGRLQLRFGRWGLAWLECLIRCSDVMSSLQIAVQNEDDGGEANE